MSTPPRLPRLPQPDDISHLTLLSVFHFVLGALSLVGLGFMLLQWFIMETMLGNPEIWKHQPGGPPPAQFMAIFKWFYLFGGACIVVAGIANVISGVFLRKRRHRMFSLVVAGLNCMAFPLGTALGVFTFIVLLRESVRSVYDSNEYGAS